MHHSFSHTFFYLFICIFPFFNLNSSPIKPASLFQIPLNPTNISSDKFALFDPMNDPDPIVNGFQKGGVNVISGEYFEKSVDLIIEGPQQVVLGREYLSSNFKWMHPHALFDNGWHLNGDSAIKINLPLVEPKNNGLPLANCMDTSGNMIYLPGSSKTTFSFKHLFNKKFSNYSKESTHPSAKNNNKNLTLNCNSKGNASLITGSKDEYVYKINNFSHGVLQLKEIRKINGNRILFNHDPILKAISATNIDHSTFYGSINMEPFTGIHGRPSRKHKKDGGSLVAIGSDGRKVSYWLEHYGKHRPRNDIYDAFYLSEIQHAHGLSENYDYLPRTNADGYQISKRYYPDGRFLQINYYSLNSNDIQNKNDFRINRVASLSAPIGTKGDVGITHKFIYKASLPSKIKEMPQGLLKETSEGSTEVYDALNHKKVYTYSKEHRLNSIENYSGTGTYKLESTSLFFWGAQGTKDEGQLISKAIKDSTQQVVYCHTYAYDIAGNVIEERIYGNLSGKSQNPIKLLKNGIPTSHDSEYYAITSTYSNDGRNLKLSESDGIKTILYTYKKGTDLLESKFICEGNAIHIREFYEYDNNTSLIKKIVDDGITNQANDLTGVTQRLMSYYKNKAQNPGVGLPLVVEERYLDLPSGQEILLSKKANSYSAYGKLVKQEIYDSENKFVYSLEWDYDLAGNLIMEKDALGSMTTYVYDLHGNKLKSSKSNLQIDVNYEYDLANRLLLEEQIDSQGQISQTKYTYNALGQILSKSDSFGTRSYIYDDCGREIIEKYPNSYESNQQIEIIKQYDVLGNITSYKDANGNITSKQFNVRGDPIAIIEADGMTTLVEYNLRGQITKKTIVGGPFVTYEYDFLDRPTQESTHSKDGQLISKVINTYNSFHKTSTTDVDGMTSQFEYDAAGRLSSVKKGNQHIKFAYDSLSRVNQRQTLFGESEQEVIIEKFKYDDLGRLVDETVESHMGEVFSHKGYSYDTAGNLIQFLSYIEEDKVEIFEKTYNHKNEIISETDPLGNKINYQYQNNTLDNTQRVKTITKTDANGLINETTLNDKGQELRILQKKDDAILSLTLFYYDGNGNRIRKLDRIFENKISQIPNEKYRDFITTWTYDNRNRIKSQIEGFETGKDKITFYHYDSLGRITSLEQANGDIIYYEYDDLNRVLRMYSNDQTIDYRYSYNLKGQITTLKNEINGKTTYRNYDDNGFLISEILETGLKIEYKRDLCDRVTLILLPDLSGIAFEYNPIYLKKVSRLDQEGNTLYVHNYLAYDLRGLLKSEIMIKGTGQIDYAYDSLGRVLNIQSKVWEETIPASNYDANGNLKGYQIIDALGPLDYHFKYDHLGRLIHEDGFTFYDYEYDSLGNRISKNGSPYILNELNQVVEENGYTYTYDANGNLLTKKSDKSIEEYTYDALNRLIEVTDKEQVAIYHYDGFNRRINKSIKGRSTSIRGIFTETDFIYFDKEEIGIIAHGKLNKLRLPGLSSRAVALELKGEIFAPIHDHNGNVACLVEAGLLSNTIDVSAGKIDNEGEEVADDKTISAQGTIAETIWYTAFGEMLIFDENNEEISCSRSWNPWCYKGKRLDLETGFIFMGDYYMNPTLGH